MVRSTLSELGALKDNSTWAFLERAHLEPMRGTFTENESYCSKQGTLIIYGEPPICKGGRSDRNEYYRNLKKPGSTHTQMMDLDFARYARFMKATDRYYSLTVPTLRVNDPTEVILFFGPPGCGKTEFARAQFPDSYILPIGKNLWFTISAVGAKHIIIDDFKKNLYLTDLLRLLDRYPLEVELKGGHIWFYPETIILTTNNDPHGWYEYNDRHHEKQALFRRFNSAYRFYKNEAKIPTPFEIDIYNPSHFADGYYPDAIRPSVNDVLMEHRHVHFDGDNYL